MAHDTALLRFWPKRQNLGEKLHRLAVLNPAKFRAIEALVDDALYRSWPSRVDPHRRGRPIVRP